MNEKSETLDLVWGAEEIGKVIGRNATQTFHLLSIGKLPARKLGKRWVAERRKLIRFFMEDEECV